ncbi:MAG: hypothetical protein JKY34_07755 [Kordiimonadaceae bacterium]|nr:hypothetical protein [Kordiimonadaceae bacterium]
MADYKAIKGHTIKNRTSDPLVAGVAGADGAIWTVLPGHAIEPTSDVSEFVFTGLAGYSKARLTYMLQASSGLFGNKTIDVRETGGTWRSLVGVTKNEASNGVLGGVFYLDNLDGSLAADFVLVSGISASLGGGNLDRTNDIVNNAGTPHLAHSSWLAGGIDEIRFATSNGNFEGSTVDRRGLCVLEVMQ